MDLYWTSIDIEGYLVMDHYYHGHTPGISILAILLLILPKCEFSIVYHSKCTCKPVAMTRCLYWGKRQWIYLIYLDVTMIVWIIHLWQMTGRINSLLSIQANLNEDQIYWMVNEQMCFIYLIKRFSLMKSNLFSSKRIALRRSSA